MKIIQLNSASVMIEDSTGDSKVKILCDPWLEGEEYLGSWAMYPPYDFNPDNFIDVDFIYVSHIHPDHSSAKTLSKLNKDIPVLIHNFPEKFLKNKIESLGFKTIELEHGVRISLKNNLHINIMAADNCDPNICGQIMGCGLAEIKFKTTQIDTIAVFDNEKQVIVNTNDCPFDIAKDTASLIKSLYGNIDVLLVGYVAASSWPHCYNLPDDEKHQESIKKQFTKLETTKKYIELLQPKYYIPFAGRYTLCGKNTVMNQYRGEPELEDAFEWLCSNVSPEKYRGIIMNNDCWLDIDTGKINKTYTPIDKTEKQKYVNDVLSKKKFPYEHEPIPSSSEIWDLIPKSYENFEKIRKKINWVSNSIIILKTIDVNNEDLIIAISCNGKGFQKISQSDIENYDQYMTISLDIRLLKWLLNGPQKAHWSNADLGSHLIYNRVGSIYKRGLFYCWNHFYSR
ncbi:MBL fold metallo-hydrolase [Nitrosopumilus sp.]|uniref:MBL fold metallo-hydrolase n=1 Tax=Nitrosopumilus sp. TaxID=2024843 RepID=UPI0034A0924D